jgi:hypothetical protein
MAIILAAKTGLWSDPATWIGGIVPGPGDVVLPNSFTVTFDVNATVAELRRDTTGGATASGVFRFSIANGSPNNLIITADVYASNAGDAGIGTVFCAVNTTGTINGTVYGNGYGPGSTGITAGIYGATVNASTGLLYVKATVQGSRGMPAVSGPMQFIDTAHASAKVRATNSLTEITLRHPDAVVPYQGDVLAEKTYGAGDYTGTLAVIGAANMNTPFSGSTVLPPHTPGPGFDEGFDSGFGA